MSWGHSAKSQQEDKQELVEIDAETVDKSS